VKDHFGVMAHPEDRRAVTDRNPDRAADPRNTDQRSKKDYFPR